MRAVEESSAGSTPQLVRAIPPPTATRTIDLGHARAHRDGAIDGAHGTRSARVWLDLDDRQLAAIAQDAAAGPLEGADQDVVIGWTCDECSGEGHSEDGGRCVICRGAGAGDLTRRVAVAEFRNIAAAID